LPNWSAEGKQIETTERFLRLPLLQDCGDGDEPLIYQAGDIRIRIDIEDDAEQLGPKSLLGLVTGLESNELTVQVSQGEQIIATTSVDQIKNFTISHLTPGSYKLILSSPSMEIHIQSLSVM